MEKIKKYKHLSGIVILILVGLSVYANSLGNHFQVDDLRMLESIKTIPRIGNLFSLRLTSRMITQMSYYLNYHYPLNWENIDGFHLLNVFVHLFNGILVYWITLLIAAQSPASSAKRGEPNHPLRPQNEASPVIKSSLHLFTQSPSCLPLFTALLFLVHPLGSEPVNYIIARHSLLATMFSFSSLLFFILYQQKTKIYYLWGTVLSIVLAGYSKEIGFYSSLFLILFYFLFFSSNNKQFGRLKGMSGWLMLFFSILILFFLGYYGGLAERFREYGLARLGDYFFTQNKIFFAYLRLLIFPFSGLNVDHYYTWTKNIFEPLALLALILNLALVFFILIWKKKGKIISFAFLSIYFFLLPYFSIPSAELMVEYRVYPAIFGYCLAVVLLINKFLDSKKLRLLVGSIIVIGFSLTTFLRNRIWHDPVSLWSDAVKKAPEKARTHSNLGTAFADAGNYEKAISELTKAIELSPGSVEPHNNLAFIYSRMGKTESAIQGYRRALELATETGDKAKIFLNLGSNYAQKEDYDKAIESYSNALKLNSNFSAGYYNLGLLYHQKNDYDRAIENFKKAVIIEPKNPEIYNALGIIYDLKGEYDLAIENYQKGIRLYPAYAAAYFNLGISYEHKNLLDDALNSYHRALALEPGYAKVYNNLGTLYYHKGDFEAAIKNYQEAVACNPHLVEGYNNLGTVYLEKKMYSEASQMFKKVLDIDPENKEAKKNYHTARSKN